MLQLWLILSGTNKILNFRNNSQKTTKLYFLKDISIFLKPFDSQMSTNRARYPVNQRFLLHSARLTASLNDFFAPCKT